jgi:alpha-beta hydrolase superfamily lysophospholipase
MKRSELKIDDIHAYRYEPEQDAAYVILIIHGMGGHGGIYEDFCEAHASKGVELWTFDLPGHGLSRGVRGDWSVDDAIAATMSVAEEIDRQCGKPIFLLASSMGSSIGMYTLNETELLRGAVFMGAAIPYFSPLREAYAFMRTEPIQQLVKGFGNSLRLDLDRYLNFELVYGDSNVAAEKKNDPLNTWTYGFEDYVKFLLYEPRTPPAENKKPILVAVGEDDPLFPPESTKQVVDAIGGPTRFYVQPNGKHQLMLFHTSDFSNLVHDWAIEQLEGKG